MILISQIDNELNCNYTETLEIRQEVPVVQETNNGNASGNHWNIPTENKVPLTPYGNQCIELWKNTVLKHKRLLNCILMCIVMLMNYL